MSDQLLTVPTEAVSLPEFDSAGWQVHLRREDTLHPLVSGNKFRKLRYNLREAQERNCHTLLTLGGAHSNHILAVAAAACEQGLGSVAWIRGEELNEQSNDTLSEAAALGMRMHFVSRSDYAVLRLRKWHDFWSKKGGACPKLLQAFGEREPAFWDGVYFLPEGGTNELAVQGCQEILRKGDEDYDLICCSVGTGGTLSGLIRAASVHQRVLGFSAIKGTAGLRADISKFTPKSNWEITDDYCLGGYGRVPDELVDFINRFRREGNGPLDPIYTGKMMLGLSMMARRKTLPSGSKILAIHTGGLQGIRGVNRRRKMEHRSTIDT